MDTAIDTSLPRPGAHTEAAGMLRALAVLLVTGTAYCLAAELGVMLRMSELRSPAIWISLAVAVSACLLVPPARWWAVAAGVAAGHYIAHLDSGIVGVRYWFAPAYVAGVAMLIAYGVRRFIPRALRFASVRDVVAWMLLVVVGSCIVASLSPSFIPAAITGRTPSGFTLGLIWRAVATACALALLLLVPAMVLTVRNFRAWLRTGSRPRLIEAKVLGLALCAACDIAYLHTLADWNTSPALLYLPMPLLLWAAARFDVGGASLAGSALALFASAGGAFGPVHLFPGSDTDRLLAVQMFVIAGAVPVLLLAAVMSERRRAVSALRARERLLRYKNAQVHELAGRLIGAQEAERSRVARELHDAFSQDLAAMSICLSQLRRESGGATGTVEFLQRLAEDLANRARTLSHELHPGVLRHVGLVAALRAHCREVASRHGLEIRFEHDPEFGRLDPSLELCLYRAAQESLANVAAHARARRVRVALCRFEEAATLSVSDDGRGIDRPGDASPGLGLVSIEERARAVGGRLSIERPAAGGTVVTVAVPYREASDAAAA